MNKETSIEWLFAHLIPHLDWSKVEQRELFRKLKEEAKQMHKEEIIKILNKREDYLGIQKSIFDYLTNEEWFLKYYNQTYGGNNENI